MQKILFTVLLSLLTTLFLNGQNTLDKKIIFHGNEQDGDLGTWESHIIGRIDSNIYIFKEKSYVFQPSYKIEQYNEKLELINSFEFSMIKEGKQKKYAVSVLLSDGKLYLLSQVYLTKLRQNDLYVQTIDPKTLQLNPDSKKLINLNYSENSNHAYSKYFLCKSNDNSKILIHYNYIKQDGRTEPASEKRLISVFDKNFNLIRKEDIDFKPNVSHEYMISNNGDIISSIYSYNKYILKCYFIDGTTKEYEVKKDKYLSSVVISFDNENNPLFGGLFSNKETISFNQLVVSNGSFLIKIDNETKQIVYEKYNEFSKDFITQFMSNDEKTTWEKSVESLDNIAMLGFKSDQMSINNDGSIILIGEENFTMSKNSLRKV